MLKYWPVQPWKLVIVMILRSVEQYSGWDATQSQQLVPVPVPQSIVGVPATVRLQLAPPVNVYEQVPEEPGCRLPEQVNVQLIPQGLRSL